MRRAHLNQLLALVAAVVVAAAPWTVSGSELAQQTSGDGGVIVRAKPVDVSRDGADANADAVLSRNSNEDSRMSA
jgi:hypothetical protein